MKKQTNVKLEKSKKNRKEIRKNEKIENRKNRKKQKNQKKKQKIKMKKPTSGLTSSRYGIFSIFFLQYSSIVGILPLHSSLLLK